MTDDTPDAEELLQQSKTQSRHTSEPTRTTDDDAPDRVDAIKAALTAIENGDAPENINLRDARLKALLVGLDDASELDDAATRVADALEGETDIDTDDVSQSDVARLLLRVGLQEALPEVLDDATEARKEKALEDATGF
ncbi:hypothetical protein D3D02_16930 [Halobellus sp. Atlit-38R]|uniref:hypothetical protein n=1 Tax=Halobellus sp. Atlit-38R TaxID=2282131 RepID=UPI000EF2495B|nr:hypothetical protein [Halobellus sp. Atlit-38R]RLM83686.1 hypothetical protein D3D02_16930 [Halobellus sp. Atlit-38R]